MSKSIDEQIVNPLTGDVFLLSESEQIKSLISEAEKAARIDEVSNYGSIVEHESKQDAIDYGLQRLNELKNGEQDNE